MEYSLISFEYMHSITIIIKAKKKQIIAVSILSKLLSRQNLHHI